MTQRTHSGSGLSGFPLLAAVFIATTTAAPAAAADEAAAARLAATTHCTTCHALPVAAHLDRRTWTNEVQPKMRVMVGLDRPTREAGFLDPQLLLDLKAFPEKPAMSEANFNLAFSHFTRSAPERLASIQDQSKIRVGLKGFETVVLPDRHAPPLTSLVRIDAANRRLLLGDAGFQGYNVLGPDLSIREGVKLGNIPVAHVQSAGADWFACIGHFFPREEPRAQVLRLVRKPGTDDYDRTVVAGGLPRVSDLKIEDFNGDGRPDFALCVYGNYVGRFSWWEGRDGDRWQEHVLWDKPGAVRCHVADLDGDGRRDLVVLFAQWLETMVAWAGDNRGGFTRHTLFQRDPSWGHSGFDLADFNGDGRPDLLVTNGDNADFSTSPAKPHHGVRIYLNRGNWKFEEAWFGPMNGAFRALARDFDVDGDLDIAAVSFFPDYEASPRESFLLFENTGGRDRLQFEPYTFPECVSGRWLTLDAGDLDGDGDEDIALGSLIRMPTAVPDFLKQQWEQKGPSLIVLRNRLK